MVATFERHVSVELAGDLETTMATMSDDPHLNHVPTMAGGAGRNGVREFYRNHLIGKFFPPDVKIVNVSRTVGEERLVEEMVVNFYSHDRDGLAIARSRADWQGCRLARL